MADTFHTSLKPFSNGMSESEKRCDCRPQLIPGCVAKQRDMHGKRQELLAL